MSDAARPRLIRGKRQTITAQTSAGPRDVPAELHYWVIERVYPATDHLPESRDTVGGGHVRERAETHLQYCVQLWEQHRARMIQLFGLDHYFPGVRHEIRRHVRRAGQWT